MGVQTAFEDMVRAREDKIGAGQGVGKPARGKPEAEAAFAGAADEILFDAKPPAGADLPGGNGATFDWTLIRGLRLTRPWFLAGGLDSGNLAGAVAASGAPMVDVSSGVERAPGVKDERLITAFLSAARRV